MNSSIRTMTDEELCCFARSTGKTAASLIIGELVARLEIALDRESDLETSAKLVAITQTKPDNCPTCGAKV
jgi:hypothetical protein